jgi:hypothetical protein
MATWNLSHYYTAMLFPRCAILLGATALSCLACHPTPSTANPVAEPQGEITVHVVNRNRIDVRVYVSHHGGIRSRLGLAVAFTTTDFSVPIRLLGAGHEYRLLGDPLGLRISLSTETLFGQAGDDVTWQLEDQFAQSTVVVH